MKWKQMLFTIVLNIFLMLLVSIMLEYANLTERFEALEDTVQEALDMAISESVHSEEFFTAQYQSKLMSYAGVGAENNDKATAAVTTVWVDGAGKFYQFNTYQFAHWYASTGSLPRTSGDAAAIQSELLGGRYGLSGSVFEWLYGKAGTSYLAPGLAYANKNSARMQEYAGEATDRGYTNSDFRDFYNQVGRKQETVGWLKAWTDDKSYTLSLETYPVLCNMGLSWMDSTYNSESSRLTADNLSSSLHIGKSRYGALNTYYFLTPSSLGVTYVPTEVLKPVFVANLDTITRLNKLAASSKSNTVTDVNAVNILKSADDCLETNVYVVGGQVFDNAEGDSDQIRNTGVDANGHATHIKSNPDENIVTDGLVEFDLSTAQIKVDYFYWDFSTNQAQSAALISKLNGTLTQNGVRSGFGTSTITELRNATLDAFINQDSARYVSQFKMQNYATEYEDVGAARIVARVTAKIRVHVPYRSAILQWANFMFTGTRHFDIKQFDPEHNRAVDFDSTSDNDGIWYQYTTYFCTSRS